MPDRLSTGRAGAHPMQLKLALIASLTLGCMHFFGRALAPPFPTVRAIGATGIRAMIAGWAYVRVDRRDLRLDFLRGYCVFAMTVDHLDAPTWLYVLTGGNRFFVSAAEGFVFISGLVMGMVYRPLSERSGMRVVATKALMRAGLLYLVTVGATLGFMWLSARFGLPWSAGIDLHEATPEVLLLLRSFYLTDVLVLYTVLIAVSPLAFWLLARRWTWLLLGISWGIWLAHQFHPVDMPWPSEEGAFYYIAAWQTLFFTALAIGWHRDTLAQRFGPLLGWRVFAISALGLVLLLVVWRWGGIALSRFTPDGGALMIDLFAKWNLPPARLIACGIVFAFFYSLVHLLWVPIRTLTGGLFLLLGQSALTAYIAQLVAVGVLSGVRDHLPRTVVATELRGTIFQLSAVALVWAVVTVWLHVRRILSGRGGWGIPRTRLDLAFGSVYAAFLAAAIVIAPLPAAPAAGFVPVRADRSVPVQPNYVLHLPPAAIEKQPLLPVIVLHDLDEDAEQFGDELLSVADREGWLLVAPQLPYESDALDPETIALESPALIRGLNQIIGELPTNTGLRVRRRALLFGYGRGAPLAGRYALAYPREVRGVALLSGGGYTLPPRMTGGEEPPFPFGVKDAPFEPMTAERLADLRRIRFWIGVGAEDSDPLQTSRAWDPYLGMTRVERAEAMAAALREDAADVELVVFPGAGHSITPMMRQAVADFATRVGNLGTSLPPRLPPGRLRG